MTNKEYIKREKAIEEIDSWLDSVGSIIVGKGLSSYGELIGCIQDVPAADAVSIVEAQDTADVAEVVSCKDCKYLMFSDFYGECSKGYFGIVTPDDFCSRGERKDGEGK